MTSRDNKIIGAYIGSVFIRRDSGQSDHAFEKLANKLAKTTQRSKEKRKKLLDKSIIPKAGTSGIEWVVMVNED